MVCCNTSLDMISKNTATSIRARLLALARRAKARTTNACLAVITHRAEAT
jgi:hypothetical protein